MGFLIKQDVLNRRLTLHQYNDENIKLDIK